MVVQDWTIAESTGDGDRLASFLTETLHRSGCDHLRPTVEVRRDIRSAADVRLHLSDRMTNIADRVRFLAESFDGDPRVASSKRSTGPGRTTVSLRLTDDYVERLGHHTDDDGWLRAALMGRQLDASLCGRRRLVGFLGANASKSLHLGHLRNIVVGNASRSVLLATGEPTSSYSLSGDIGRSVCEALAGHRLQLVDLGDAGLRKSDVYIGECYRAYLERSSATSSPVDDPCEREYRLSHDLADELLGRWWSRDETVLAQWRWLVDEVDRGHRATLDALGVTIDEWWPESHHVDHAIELVDHAARSGIARRLPDGRTVFDSTVPGFPVVVLTRSDGFPTEHARVIAVFHRLFTSTDNPLVHLDYNGTEWEPAQAALTQLMQALGCVPERVTHVPAIHGMVVIDDVPLSSRGGEPPLIDDLLAALASSAEIDGLLAATANGAELKEYAIDVVVKTFILSTALAKPLHYSWSRLLDPSANPGWTVAEAACRHASAARRAAQRARPDGGEPTYRLAVLQAQTLPLEAAKCVQADGRVDLSHLLGLLISSARRLLDSPPGTAGADVSGTTVRQCLDVLGYRSATAGEMTT